MIRPHLYWSTAGGAENPKLKHSPNWVKVQNKRVADPTFEGLFFL